MKKLEIIVRAARFDDVKDTLDQADVHFLTFSNVKAFGRHRERAYRGNFYDENTISRVKLEVVVRDEIVESLISKILEAARTGEVGDGKIIVSSIDQVYRIRTGETGATAL